MGDVVRDIGERQRLVDAYRASGEGVEVFAAREGVAKSTLYGWLHGRGMGAARTAKPLHLARVIRKPAEQARTTGSGLVLQLGEVVRVALTAGFDQRALAEVLDVVAKHGRAR